MKREIWKDIKGYEGYQVSNFGRVRTFNKISKRKTKSGNSQRVWKDRILKFKGNTYKTGYRVDLWKDNKPHTLLVARLVAYTFYDKDINDLSLTVNHIDGNRLNNNLDNLEIISIKDNINHSFDTGLHTNSIFIRLFSKKDGTSKVFRSMSKASEYMSYNDHYLKDKFKKGKYENKDFSWEKISKEEYLMEVGNLNGKDNRNYS